VRPQTAILPGEASRLAGVVEENHRQKKLGALICHRERAGMMIYKAIGRKLTGADWLNTFADVQDLIGGAAVFQTKRWSHGQACGDT